MGTKIRWTPEEDEQLTHLVRSSMSSTKAAVILGKSSSALKKRCRKLGLHFSRSPNLSCEGHIPADQKSAELLRAAGVRI